MKKIHLLFFLSLNLLYIPFAYMQNPKLKISMHHSMDINGLAYSNDGKYIASASWDMTVKLWDAKLLKEIRTLKGHTSWVYSVMFSPDDNQLLSTSKDGTIIIWDILTGDIIKKLEVSSDEPYPDEIYSTCYSPDGKYIVAAYYGDSNNIKVWEVESGKIIKTLNTYESVSNISYSPDGKYFITNGHDSSYIFDAKTYQKLASTNYCKSAHFSIDSKNIILVQYAQNVYIYNIESGKEELIFSAEDYFYSSDISINGDLLVLGSGNGNIYLIDLLKRKLINKIKVMPEYRDYIYAIKFSKDSKAIIYGGQETQINIIKTERFYENIETIVNTKINGKKILISNSGNKIIFENYVPYYYSEFDSTFTATILNTETNISEKYEIKFIKDQDGVILQTKIEDACFTNDEKIVAIADDYAIIYLYDLTMQKCLKKFSLNNFMGADIHGIKFSNNDSFLIFHYVDGNGSNISCYKSNGDSVWTITYDELNYFFLEFDADGNIVTFNTTPFASDSAYIIDIHSGKLIKCFYLGKDICDNGSYFPIGISENHKYVYMGNIEDDVFILAKTDINDPSKLSTNKLNEIQWNWGSVIGFREIKDYIIIATNVGIYIYSKDLSLINKYIYQSGELNDIQITASNKIIGYFDWDHIKIFDFETAFSTQSHKPFDAVDCSEIYIESTDSSKLIINGINYISRNAESYLIDYSNGINIKLLDFFKDSKLIENGNYIFSESSEGKKGIYSANNFTLIEEFDKRDTYLIEHDITSDGKYWIEISNKEIKFINRSNKKKQIRLRVGKYEEVACISPDNKYLLTVNTSVKSDSLYLYDIKMNRKIWSLESNDRIHFENAIITDNNLLYMMFWDSILAFDINSKKVSHIFNISTDKFNSMFVCPDNSLLIASENNKITLWDLKTFQKKWAIIDENRIKSTCISGDKKYVITGNNNGYISFRDINNGNEIIRVYLFGTNDYVVYHKSGLFDATPAAMNKLYYVQGLEIIDFNQLKDRYWEPGLWKKIMDGEELRDVQGFDEALPLFPKVENLVINNGKIEFELVDNGGGIGKYMIYVNDKEIFIGNLPKDGIEFKGESLKVSYSIKDNPYLKPGDENEIKVKAYNAENFIVSRGAVVSYKHEEKLAEAPNIFIISCGVSDYTGDDIDLRYSAKDADDMDYSLKVGAEKLFGKDKTYTYLLSTNQEKEKWPTKENISKTFNDIASKAKSTDVIVVYLSGHGINWGGQNGDFYYLTQDAYTANASAYNDPAIRDKSTLSTNELVELFKLVPATKQVLIIDACASGQVVEDLLAQRDIESSTIRALDRMKDRTGMFIITGSAADAVSYEASKYGQGLLTYSLLEGIKGASLREGQFIDVNQLFQWSRDRVPDLAKGIGGIQQPQVFSPYGSASFDIGLLEDHDKTKIPLAKAKPIFVMSQFMNTETFADELNLEYLVDEKLRSISAKGKEAKLIFYDAKNFPEAYQLRGQYSISGDDIELKFIIFLGKENIQSIEVSGDKNQMEVFVDEVIGSISDVLEVK